MSPFDCASRTDALTDCDQRSGACVPPRSCSPANPSPGPDGGPDSCRYGQACSGTTCVPVQGGNCLGAVQAQWDQRDEGPVIVSASGNLPTSDPGLLCPGGDRMLTASITFYAPLQFSCDPANPAPSVTFIGPDSAGLGGRFDSTFLVGAPTSGAFTGTFTAGLCDFTDARFAGWSVTLTDSRGKSGNVMCLQ
jgi:hypothetical protein